jgi:hypothetical protein
MQKSVIIECNKSLECQYVCQDGKCMSYEEEVTCMSYEEEVTCMSVRMSKSKQ